MRQKGQAMVEYVLLLSVIALGFIAGTQIIRDAVKGLFSLIGAFFSKKGP